jgi:hypothetical protein
MSRNTKTTPNSLSRPGLVGLKIDRGRMSSPRGLSPQPDLNIQTTGLDSGSGLPLDRCPHESVNINPNGQNGPNGPNSQNGQNGPTSQNGPTGNWSQVTPAQWDKFWIEDYRVLFQNPTLLPTTQMTEIQRLNTLTRLILLIVIILAICRLGNWLLFLVLGLGLVILLYFIQKRSVPSTSPPVNPSSQEHYRCPHHGLTQATLSARSTARESRLSHRRSVLPLRLRPK